MWRPQTWTRLTWPTGNNAFAYEQRKRADPDPKLRLSELKTITTIDEIELWTLPTFTELDDHDNVITYTGLKYIYHIPFCTDAWQCVPPSTDVKNGDVKNYVPTYIFDNHNYALYFWAKQWAINNHPYTVIHIDQHSDLGTPPEWLPVENMDVKNYVPTAWNDIAHYSTHICNVGNFIRPALDAWIISDCLRIKNQYDLEQFDGSYPSLHKENYILDIDLDFRAPEMGTDLTKSIPLVQSLMREASLITIASSPYFLDQNYALEVLGRLFEK
jgi:hypothetical protein